MSEPMNELPDVPALRGVDPDIRRFVMRVNADYERHTGGRELSVAEMREVAEKVRAPWRQGGPVMSRTREVTVPTPRGPVRLRVHDPGVTQPAPALVYMHGGGWTLFSLDTHDRLMREYAARAGVTVVGVDYALAPEAKYPIALRQIAAAVRFLASCGEELAVDPQRLAIGGDSAGANLAVATALELRDAGEPRCLRALLLNYGVFARSSSPEAVLGLGGPGNMLTAEEMESFWRNYLRDERDALDPFVCPLLAELGGLPPALLVVAEEDLLAEQSVELHRRLGAAGVSARLASYPGASHSFLEAVSIAAVADRALAESADWLRATLAVAA